MPTPDQIYQQSLQINNLYSRLSLKLDEDNTITSCRFDENDSQEFVGQVLDYDHFKKIIFMRDQSNGSFYELDNII